MAKSKKQTNEELPLGGVDDQDYKEYEAIANEKLIKQIATMLKSIGDINVKIDREIRVEELTQREQRRLSFREIISYGLKNIFETIDVVLTWLEHCSKEGKKKSSEEDIQLWKKKEGVLRGLYHITALGSTGSFLALLELACKFLDVPENPFQAEQKHITACLSKVENQTQQLNKLIIDACSILQTIIRESQLDHNKATSFDNIVQQAKDEIESCKELLATADKTIKKLTKNMSMMKWFSRALRITGWGLTCYGLYHFTPLSTSLDKLAEYVSPNTASLIQNSCFNPKLKVIFMPTAFLATGYLWMSLFPSRAYAFHDSLADLEFQHLRLTKEIQALERRLKTAVNTVDGLKKSKAVKPNLHQNEV